MLLRCTHAHLQRGVMCIHLKDIKINDIINLEDEEKKKSNASPKNKSRRTARRKVSLFMPKTVTNQKVIHIHKPSYTKNFLQIGNDEWQAVSADKENLGRTALQLYLYLAANANGYQFALSQQAVENAVGIGRTSYDKYLKRLEDMGYIVWRHGNVYDFYTTPRPANERTQHHKNYAADNELNFDDPTRETALSPLYPDPYFDFSAEREDDTAAQNELPHYEQALPQNDQTMPPDNREIDNKYSTDNDETNDTDSGTLCVPPPAADAACASRGKVIEVRIPNPLPPERRKPKEKPKPFAFPDDDIFNRTDPETGEYIF